VTGACNSVEIFPSFDVSNIKALFSPSCRRHLQTRINSIYWMAAIWWRYLLVTVINLANW